MLIKCNYILYPQRLTKKFVRNMGIKLSSVATLTAHNTKASEVGEGWHSSALFNQVMFAVLHVLLNSLALLNPVQSYHPCSHEYTDMQPFAMHFFQWCERSLKSVSKILGVIYPPLLHWCSQCYMCCSIAPHVNTQSIPKKFMHQFWKWAVHHC